jgi:hypothetical protein
MNIKQYKYEFSFMEDMGYSEFLSSDENEIIFHKNMLTVTINFDSSSYEFNCYIHKRFYRNDITLCDLVSYYGVTDYRCRYQLSSMEHFEEGVSKIAECLCEYGKEVLTDNSILYKTIQLTIKHEDIMSRKKEYIMRSLTKADVCWTKGNKKKAIRIYKNHFECLTYAQKRHLIEYDKRKR